MNSIIATRPWLGLAMKDTEVARVELNLEKLVKTGMRILHIRHMDLI